MATVRRTLVTGDHFNLPGVEALETFLASNASESTGKSRSEARLRNKTDTSSLERAESDIGEELRDGG